MSIQLEKLEKMTPDSKIIGGVAAIMFGAYIAKNSYFKTEAGLSYVVQNQLTGALNVYKEPGFHFRVPFFSTVTPYRHVITISFGDAANHCLFNSPYPVKVRFADTYHGAIPCTFRFRLSQNDDEIRQMHKDFRGEDSLADKLLARNCKHVVVITATQYTGEEFFQGGLNEFKAKLVDQLKDGIYKTERKQVSTQKLDIAPVPSPLAEGAEIASTGRTPHRLQQQNQMVWKTVNVLDENGQPMRAETHLEQYGITVTQVTVGDPSPETLLEKLLIDKKKLVGARIRAVQEQDTAQAEAKTAQVVKNIERTKAVQDAQREKELAIINEQRQVEVAKQVAEKQKVESQKLKDLAVIDKLKELEIAQSNKEIYKANAEAAKYDAIAIRAKGEAEAAVLAAKYKALGANKEIYLAEVQRDVARLLYTNLSNFKVVMPTNYIGGGGEAGKLTTNLDVISGFAALGMMDQTLRKGK